MRKVTVIEDNGGALVKVRTLDDSDEFHVPRKRLREIDGVTWLLSDLGLASAERRARKLEADRERIAAQRARLKEEHQQENAA